MRGEKLCQIAGTLSAAGSPPRTRGKGSAYHKKAVLPGITPAYAGKSMLILLSYSPRRDHPRVRGEKLLRILRGFRLQGSPPRTRGKAGQGMPDHQRTGITPAYAGKSSHHQALGQGTEDHPRVRGEKSRSGPKNRSAAGSPPRTRGKVCEHLSAAAGGGITPAYAGKRVSVRSASA